MSVFLNTLRDIKSRTADHPAVLVAFSGGKDSLAVLDLCLRHFRRVECFHLELVSDLDVTRERVAEPLARLGVPCRYYPDPVAFKALKHGIFCDPKTEYRLLTVPTARDAYEEAMADTGIGMVATGKKKADYRQRAFHMNAGRVFGWHPIREWKKADVLAYLQVRGITPPPSHAEAGGIDLTVASLRWLRATHPADFARVAAWFPYCEAALVRTDPE